MNPTNEHKPIIGISCGDINGIGTEIILKTLSDNRIMEFCTPVIFGNNKLLNFYRKSLPEMHFSFSVIKDMAQFNPKQVNVLNCWDEEIIITPGVLNETGGQYAVTSLRMAAEALKAGKVAGLVTAPIHKKNVQSADFNFSGHTPFLKNYFAVKDVAMMMVAENMRIALLTEHVPIKDITQHITIENILLKLGIINESLKKDFLIVKPKIAVLGLNPHAGDEGLVGKEEIEIIKPAIKEAKQKNIFCFGPYSADAFFARGQFRSFDAVLALYHDQGLIPFKSLALGEGVNFTAGLGAVRTSPDHGTAFDIAGKGIADESSFREALFTAIDIINNRKENKEQFKNPLRKLSASVIRNAIDE
ncbi:MAG: 4-hydroxythreonine-4-phosphate dehydrogenase PdxA [Niastella sp. SCN 39-18]|nr:4-hydroxythreonine-4-phosphate dehydrogenase PdxA [Sphingobacteriales bacterium]ODT53503.1 MAG: 4-hydroxythreonine-4-phosphate dehydrogenase PdxA [Niastella sp. SCN 39-18]OJW11456.1 MAG: 4-hydroxythreonine-4-phosphate dehydrogenase PdxA [Sphingobacteriales bacterium 39-19]